MEEEHVQRVLESPCPAIACRPLYSFCLELCQSIVRTFEMLLYVVHLVRGRKTVTLGPIMIAIADMSGLNKHRKSHEEVHIGIVLFPKPDDESA